VKQGVALLPLRFQGPRDSEYLGDSLTEALIDQLSRVRGLRVSGSGVTARFRDERDPRTVGRELGVELVVDGTVQCAGSMARVSVRLLEARSGTQLWSGRFEYASTDAFELQDRLVPRVAEGLRCELILVPWHANTPPEALALYRQAAVHVHEPFRNGPDSPLNLLESCLELAPDFLPAISLHAIASLRAWFSASRNADRDWAAAGRASVERALRLAPELATTHLARTMLAAQQDDWRTAVVSLRTSLDIAPLYPAALQYLGTLQCEAGRADEGLPRLRLAYELDPSHVVSLFELARCSALRGKMDDYGWAMERLRAATQHRFGAMSLRARVAAWRRDQEELRRCQESLRDEQGLSVSTTRDYVAVALGEVDALVLAPSFEKMLSQASSPRFVSMLCQISTEMLCISGHAEQALGYFQRAADTALIDLEWIDRCPVLEPLRALPGFAEGRRKVRARIEAIWNA
jgi:serine/threonine-protein kinase